MSRSKPADLNPHPDTAPPSTATTEVDAADFSNPSSATLPAGSQTSLPTSLTTFSTDTSQPPDSAGYDPLALQEASKEGWTKLFSRRPPPRCESHAEPWMSRTTKKPGVNRGRQFWMCSRCVYPMSSTSTSPSHMRSKVPNTPSHPRPTPHTSTADTPTDPSAPQATRRQAHSGAAGPSSGPATGRPATEAHRRCHLHSSTSSICQHTLTESTIARRPAQEREATTRTLVLDTGGVAPLG